MTPTEQIDTKELRKLAEAATPGPWIAAGPSFGAALPAYCNEVLVDREGDEDDTYTVAQLVSGLATEPQATADMKYIAAANPAAILALLDERDEWRERALRAEAAAGAVPEGLRHIGELLRTQDNRYTDQPMFVVQQKRRITGIDTDYCDNIVWLANEDDHAEADAEKAAQLEAAYQDSGAVPQGWTRTGYMDQWEFVTAGFTEQGCKDYLARDGHNLKEPRIYAEGSYRNEEYRTLRNWLISLAAAPSAPVAASNPDAGENAPWLTLAHMICSDAGISPGCITGRLEALREKLAAQAEPVLWFKRLDAAHALPDGRCYSVVFTEVPDHQPLYATPPAPMQEAGSGWISVEERLPEWARRDDTPCIIDGRSVPPTLTSEKVNVALDSGAVRIDNLIAIEGGAPWFEKYGKRVTHWMPLPKAPRAIATSREEA